MVVGFVDIGSNASRLLIADLGAGRIWRTLATAREPLRLTGYPHEEDGEPEAVGGAAAGLVRVVRSFLETCARYDAQEVIAVATAGLREAPDRAMLLERLREETGLTVELLDGEEEARLSYLGLAAAVDLGRGRSLCLDLGGGSTEVAAGQREEVLFAASLPLGAVSLTLEIRPADPEGRVGDAAWASLLGHARRIAAPALAEAREYAPYRAYGIAGTIRSLVSLTSPRSGRRPGSASSDDLTLGAAEQLARELRAMSVQERIAGARLYPDRADVIVAGAAIVVVVMQELGLETIRFLSTGLREGMVVRYLRSH